MTNYVAFWTPSPEIEIGQVRHYSSFVTTGMAIELAGYNPTCILQLV
jgi:hypothetical protein